jgi:putative transposase
VVAAGTGHGLRRSTAVLVSEASVYRLLKAQGLITSPAFILLKAADHFAQPTTAINQLWQTDFSAP